MRNVCRVYSIVCKRNLCLFNQLTLHKKSSFPLRIPSVKRAKKKSLRFQNRVFQKYHCFENKNALPISFLLYFLGFFFPSFHLFSIEFENVIGTQKIFPCLKPTIEIQEKVVKCVQSKQ